jgi:hypothetical protein
MGELASLFRTFGVFFAAIGFVQLAYGIFLARWSQRLSVFGVALQRFGVGFLLGAPIFYWQPLGFEAAQSAGIAVMAIAVLLGIPPVLRTRAAAKETSPR